MELQSILQRLQIPALNSMQEEVLKQFVAGQDTIIVSPTGSGKTLAFALLIKENLRAALKGTLQVLIIVPSRELALQIESVVKVVLNKEKVVCVYGGNSTLTERNKLKEVPSILIGTPGRIIYHIERNEALLENVETIILDEFDKSLEFGFEDQINIITNSIPASKQKILTSATELKALPSFIKPQNLQKISFLDSAENIPDIELKKVVCSAKNKLKTLYNIICNQGDKKIVVFFNHREAVTNISNSLTKEGIPHDIYHGQLEQKNRELALIKFRNDSNRILLATDLASRGLDIPAIDLIVHYQLPTKEADFIHRNGRTARMQNKGEAIVILQDNDQVPDFIKAAREVAIPTFNSLPPIPPYVTLHLPLGKKNKVNKTDLVGYLIKSIGIEKDAIGKIDVHDKESFIALQNNSYTQSILSNNGKIKGNKVKFSLV